MRWWGRAAGWSALVGCALCACLQSATVVCGDGIVCPAGTVCVPGGRCAEPEQLEMCAGQADGTPCILAGIGGGLCVEQLCVSTRCGDGKVDPGEACDTPENPEACTTNCALPTCGDGIKQAAEICDDGAANADDRACTSRCLPAMCGDGFIHAGVEECDDRMLNANTQPCTAACLRNVCGDSAVWAGVEPCDDGNTISGDGCRADCRKHEMCGDAAVDSGEACDDGNVNPADGCNACVATEWIADAILGGNIPGTSVGLTSPYGVAVDVGGNIYVADQGNDRIRRIDRTTGAITTVAGTGVTGYSGDNGPATAAKLSHPQGITIDGLGNLFIADTFNYRIRRIDAATGIITTVAGSGVAGVTGDNGPATSARLDRTYDVDVDGLGNLYITDTGNSRIRRVDVNTHVITTVAGTTAGFFGDNGLATDAQLSWPYGMTIASDGALIIGDTENDRIRRVDPSTGIITTIGGGGTGTQEDGVPAAGAHLYRPASPMFDAAGNLRFADIQSGKIRMIGTNGILSSLAGSGSSAFSGDGGPASAAGMTPWGFAIDRDGTMYLSDNGNHRVRRIDGTTQTITTVAGTGTGQFAFVGNGLAAASAILRFPWGVAVDATGNVFFADKSFSQVRRIDPAGVITTIAGTGAQGITGDGGQATAAQLSGLRDLAFDSTGALYMTAEMQIRRIDPITGVISTVAGKYGAYGYSGDGAAATNAQFDQPGGIAFDSTDRLYIADTYNHRVRRVENGIVTTIAGTGTNGFFGDDGLATDAKIDTPYGVALDAAGNLFIADMVNCRIRRVDVVTGKITTYAGNGSPGVAGDNGQATSANIAYPRDVAVMPDGDLLIAEYYNRIRRVDSVTGIITTFAGSVAGPSGFGFRGDGGLAINALLNDPTRLIVDAAGNVFVTESGSYMIRRIDGATGIITSLAGGGSSQANGLDPEGMGPIAKAQARDARAFVQWPDGALIAAGESGTVQAMRTSTGMLEVVTGRYSHDVATANLARFRTRSFGRVGGIAYDATAGKLYLTESSANVIHVVTVTDPADENTWTIAPLAGNGTAGFTNGTSALTAQFRQPSGLYLDAAAQLLYVADTGNHAIRAIALGTMTVSSVAGVPATLGYSGDSGAATSALLYGPVALTRCPNGDLFIADTGNNRIRRVSGGLMTTVLGDGVAASSGEGTPAKTFPVNTPSGVACDPFGNLFVSSSTAIRMLPASDTGVVSGDGEVQTIYAATPALGTYCLTGLTAPDATTIHAADSCTGMLVRIHRQAK